MASPAQAGTGPASPSFSRHQVSSLVSAESPASFGQAVWICHFPPPPVKDAPEPPHTRHSPAHCPPGLAPVWVSPPPLPCPLPTAAPPPSAHAHHIAPTNRPRGAAMSWWHGVPLRLAGAAAHRESPLAEAWARKSGVGGAAYWLPPAHGAVGVRRAVEFEASVWGRI